MVKAAVRNVAHAVVRRLLPPPGSTGPSRREPMSREFGLDRGMPIDRRYIGAFLRANVDCIRGVGLEIAEPTYAAQYRDRLSSVEILHVDAGQPNATVVGDLTRPETLPAELADCFICTQTLPFIFDVASAVAGIRRVLKPGGTVLATVSGIAQVSRYDMDRWGDFWRFTPLSARRLFEQSFAPDEIVIQPYGNLLAAKALLDGLSVEDMVDPAALDPHDPDYPVTIGIRATRKAG